MNKEKMDVSIFHKEPKRQIVSGWVVNVHDALNFDIDLSLTPKQRHSFRHVITNEYEYKEKSSGEDTKIGVAYRCRLKGIQLLSNRDSYRETESQIKKTKRDMKQMIDRCDGWVVVFIDTYDIYNRLLIDLIDPALFPEYIKPYKDILFERYPHIFTEYSPHHNKKKNKY